MRKYPNKIIYETRNRRDRLVNRYTIESELNFENKEEVQYVHEITVSKLKGWSEPELISETKKVVELESIEKIFNRLNEIKIPLVPSARAGKDGGDYLLEVHINGTYTKAFWWSMVSQEYEELKEFGREIVKTIKKIT